ncbi:hypothetical protein [Erythrobacter sp. Alg231-14]|uniref:hypothetical protein n=1 Tax=Erythrobacter sp. Alg231-14 TaxID=1922225 RepID=UPI000D55CA82
MKPLPEMKRERDTGQIVITFIGGTCHYHSEAYLDPVSITFLSFERLTRFTAAEIEPDQSDLIQFSDEELPEGVNLEFAELMVRAIADGDQAAFLIAANEASRPDKFVVSDDLQIQARVIQEIGEGDARLEVGEQSSSLRGFYREMWLRAVDAKFSARKVRGVDAPERRLYFLRSTIEYEALYPGENHPREVIVCWCKSEDCSDKWPVLARDADALNSRPYFCLSVDQYKVSGKETLSTSVELPSTEYGFAEPDWDGDGRPG